jgi:Fic family protein
MSRKVNLVEIVGRFPQGVSVEEVMLALGPEISRRTVQRWLASLVEEGKLKTVGKGKRTRYLLREEEISGGGEQIPLSSKGREIEWRVSQPLQVRKGVTYHRDFLENYVPNSTYYLSENLRKKLRELGQGREGTYPAGTYAQQVFGRLLIDLSWNSSRLEGNTYSLLETKRLIEEGKFAAGKSLKDTQMILNHKAAIEFLVRSAGDVGVNRYTLLNLHTLLSDNLMPDPAACGRLRAIPVAISHSVYQPSGIPQVIEECFDLLLEKARAISDPFEQSFFLMVQLPYLQPFDDVNKRTSRLAANIPLIQKNFCPLSFIDVPETIYVNGLLGVYELNEVDLLRDVFEWAYEKSCLQYASIRQTVGEPDPFRFKYRPQIQKVIREVVLQKLNREEAVAKIRELSQQIEELDRSRFVEIVERELLALHEGNIARYQISLPDFRAWKLAFI